MTGGTQGRRVRLILDVGGHREPVAHGIIAERAGQWLRGVVIGREHRISESVQRVVGITLVPGDHLPAGHSLDSSGPVAHAVERVVEAADQVRAGVRFAVKYSRFSVVIVIPEVGPRSIGVSHAGW